MRTINSNLNVKTVVQTSCAEIFFIDNIVIVEIKRHSIIGQREILPILDAIILEVGDLSAVHYISNRVDIYSLKPIELIPLKAKIDKFKSYSAITYEHSANTNLVFERMFLKKPMIRYSSLMDAVEAIRFMDETGKQNFSVA